MEKIYLILLIGLTVSYDPSAAVSYALKHCASGTYNSKYISYPGNDCANFVSQCLIAGGQSLKGCPGVNGNGCVPLVSNLRACLAQKGWKSSNTKPAGFKAGYPMIYGNDHAVLATSVNGGTIKYSAHSNDRCNSGFYGSPTYYYL